MHFSKALVTGAGGLIGSAICRELSVRGIAVRAVLADGESDENIRGLRGVEMERCDIRNLELLSKLARGCDAVFHLAALNRLWHRPIADFYSINVDGTANACKAAQDAGVKRFIHTSSCEVMGPAEAGIVANEERRVSFSSMPGPYEKSKFFAEQVVRDFASKGLRATIIRPTAVVGPNDIHGTPPARLITKFIRGGIKYYYNAGINIVDSRDVAAAHVEALLRGGNGDVYIAGGHNIMLRELFNMLSDGLGMKARPREIGYRVAYLVTLAICAKSAFTGEDPGITTGGVRTIRHPWFFDNAKARRDLKLTPRPLAETIRDAVAWHARREAISL